MKTEFDKVKETLTSDPMSFASDTNIMIQNVADNSKSIALILNEVETNVQDFKFVRLSGKSQYLIKFKNNEDKYLLNGKKELSISSVEKGAVVILHLKDGK